MARKKTVEIDFIADTSKATRGIKDVGDTAQKQESKFKRMGNGVKLGFAAAAVGVGIAVDFLKDATLAAAEDERAQADLKLALQNTTKATDDQVAAAERFIEKTSLATGVADDELRPALETLTRATGDLEEAQDLLTIAMDIAAATGKPLQGVIDAMSKAIQNKSIGALGRLGLKVKDVEGNFLTFDEVMGEAQRTMGGAMETAAGTGAGAMARMDVAMEEAKEKIGAIILPAIVNLIEGVLTFKEELDTPGDQSWIDGLITNFLELEDAGKKWEDAWKNPVTDELGASFAALGELLGLNTVPALGDALRGMEDVRTHGVEPLIDATEGLMGAEEDLGDEIKTTMDRRQESFDQMQSQLDPFFAYTEAVDAQADAQAEVNRMVAANLEDTPEYLEALKDKAEKTIAVKDAELKLLSSGGLTREEFENQRVAMGLTREEAQRLIEKYDILFTERNVTNTIRTREIVESDSTGRTHVGGRHQGGVVPGDYRGQEVLIKARAGEHVSQSGNPGHNGNGNGGGDIVIQVDGREIARAVRPHAIRDNKTGKPWQ